MKIIQLKPENKKLFMDFDPLFKLEWVDMPGSFALAALDENVEKKELNKAGIIVCSYRTNIFVIEWLYIAPEYRGQKIAENLLEIVFEYAEKKGMSRVGARFCEYEEYNIWMSSKPFFEERLFFTEKQLPGEWVTNLVTLSRKVEDVKGKTSYEVVPLSHLSANEHKKMMLHLTDAKIPSLYPLKGYENTLDEDVSVVIKDNEKILGALFVKSISTSLMGLLINGQEEIHTIYPVLFYMHSPKYAMSLIDAAIKRASVKFPKDTAVRFVLREIDASDLIDRFCPEGKIDTTLLIATTSDYEIWKSYRAYAE